MRLAGLGSGDWLRRDGWKRARKIYRGMEQLVARRAHNPKAGGSSPPPATKEVKQQCLTSFFISHKQANP